MKPQPLYNIPAVLKVALPIAKKHAKEECRDDQLMDVLEEHYLWSFDDETIHGDYRPFGLDHVMMKQELEPAIRQHIEKLVRLIKRPVVEGMRALSNDDLKTHRVVLPPRAASIMRFYLKGITDGEWPGTLFGRKLEAGKEARVETDGSNCQWRPIDLSAFDALVG